MIFFVVWWNKIFHLEELLFFLSFQGEIIENIQGTNKFSHYYTLSYCLVLYSLESQYTKYWLRSTPVRETNSYLLKLLLDISLWWTMTSSEL